MKIFYLGNFTEVGSPLGYSPMAQYIGKSFELEGVQVTMVNECDVMAKDVLRELQNGYDLLLTEEARLRGDHKGDDKGLTTNIQKHFAEVMDNCKIPVIAWLTNIFWGISVREVQIYQNPIFKADIVFSTDGGHEEKWKQAGVNHVLLRQGIYLPEAILGKPNPAIKAEIVFIGAVYEHIWHYRKKLVDFLKSTYGERFAHVGQRGELRHQALADYIASVKIVIGDSVYSPRYWSNRIYEMIGRGAFFIHPKVEGLDEEFPYYKTFVPYDIGNFNQLKGIIDYYLEHDEERNRIRLAGYEHCKREHTYQIRVRKMMDIFKKYGIFKQRDN